jgi:hypothetical protein
MQQACKKCGYESPEADKFCRQCGSQFALESEFSSATTLNHGRVEPNPPIASVGTGRFPPSVGDAIAGDTERYYSPPQYASAPANIERPPTFALLNPSPAPSTRLKSFSTFMRGMFTFLLVGALLLATGLAVFFSQEAKYERLRSQQRGGRDNGEQANGRAQNAWDQMEEALQLAHESAERAASAGAAITINGDKPIDLGKYTYPDAQVEAKIDSHGNEAVSLLTHKEFNEVQKYYEHLLGAPVLQVAVHHYTGRQLKKLLYQSPTLPTILVKVEEIENGQVKITILHSFLRFPRFNDAQAQNLR